MRRFENLIRNSYPLKWMASKFLKFVCHFYPAFDANRLFKRHFGRKMNLKNPLILPEKIVWMELYTDTSMWTYCEDKYLMREYVERKGYGEYLPKLYGVWQNAEDIDFSILPKEFVMKANHGCGDVFVCHNKYSLNKENVIRYFKRILNITYGYNCAALHYTKIKPCIVAEEVLSNDYINISSSMVDFKVWCINGVPKSIMIVYDRNSKKHSVDLYDTEWNRLPKFFNIKNPQINFEKESRFKSKPLCLDEMLKIAEDLSDGFPEVRVDFYIVNSKPIIGEMTFAAGYTSLTYEYYKLLAEDVKLVNKERLDE